MRRTIVAALGAAMILCLPSSNRLVGQLPPGIPGGRPAMPPGMDIEKKYEDFDKVVKGAKVHEGLFKLHLKDDRLYAEISPSQMEKPFLCPIAIARGMGMGGHTLNFEEQWVLMFKKVGDRVHLIRRNVHFQARKGTPVAKAVETTYNDSVLMALRIQTMNGGSVVINLNDIFMTDFAQLNFGMLDPSRSTWHKVKAFPSNIELQVSATFARPSFGGRSPAGDNSVIDPRGNTIVIHYGLCELPGGAYQPRLADDRVGYFLTAHQDYSSDNKDTSFVRYINRWRLERAEPVDPKNPNKLSAPKKKIVYWIEKSVPDEYRAYVREGILEWNKAFEKIGFRDAIEVRQQEGDRDDFDPEDINYNTFRWITTGGAFAMGPSRANPLTGEIMDADIIFDADMIRHWKQEYQIMRGGVPTGSEPPSKIQAAKLGWGLGDLRLLPGTERLYWDERDPSAARNASASDVDRRDHLLAVRHGLCQCGAHMKYQLGLAEMAIVAAQEAKPGEKPGDKVTVPEELIAQAIKHVVMHEVGHTLGLRHNFKASIMLKHDQLHDTNITRKQGIVASVMDYSPVNLAPKGVKQGDYFSTTLGPYDYWAIEYGYKPLGGGTEGEVDRLKEIACKGATPGHDYATDEDNFGASDPLINVWDLGSDPLRFAQGRMVLAEDLLKGLAERVVDKGEGYQRLRVAFGMLINEYGDAAFLVSNFVGGEYIHRDHRGDPNGRDPFVPVKGAKQREALKFLQDHILNEKPFQFSPELLRRLAAERWMHWGYDRMMFQGVEYPIYSRILAIQRIVLRHALSPDVMTRIQNNALKAEKEDQPLTAAEVFRSLTDSIWNELPQDGKPASDPKRSMPASIIRRNLQREYMKDLTNLVLGPKGRGSSDFFIVMGPSSGGSAPPDARSLARMHLREINKRIELALKDAQITDDTTRAHLEECNERISKVLGASVQVND